MMSEHETEMSTLAIENHSGLRSPEKQTVAAAAAAAAAAAIEAAAGHEHALAVQAEVHAAGSHSYYNLECLQGVGGGEGEDLYFSVARC